MSQKFVKRVSCLDATAWSIVHTENVFMFSHSCLKYVYSSVSLSNSCLALLYLYLQRIRQHHFHLVISPCTGLANANAKWK